VWFGSNFGTASDVFTASIGATSAATGSWISHTERVITPSRGIGSNLVLSVTVSDQTIASASRFSYNAPILSSVQAPTSHSTGSQIVNVFGSNYGNVQYSLRNRIGSTAVEATIWSSDTSLKSLSNRGTAHGQSVLISQNNDRVIGHVAFSFNAAQPSSVSPSLFPTSGNAPISIFGHNFASSGHSGTAKVGFTACMSSGWTADSSFSCKVPPGTGQLRSIVVSVELAVGTLSRVVDYKGPDVSSVQPMHFSTTGTVAVSVFGAGFVNSDLTPKASFGTAASLAQWNSDTAIRCRVVAGSVNVPLVVSVASGTGSLTGFLSYDVPSQSSVAFALFASTGSVSITVFGSNTGASYSQKVLISGSSCESTSWISDSSLQSRLTSGISHSRIVSVSSGKRSSSGLTVSYSSPVYLHVGNACVPSTGSANIQTIGRSFGLNSYSGTSRTGGSSSVASLWVADSCIASKSPSVVVIFKQASVTVGRRESVITSAISYIQVIVKDSFPVTAAATGSQSITVLGNMFQAHDPTAFFLRFGVTASVFSSWISDSSVKSKIAPGVSAASVHVSFDRAWSFVASKFSYMQPSASGMHPGEAPTTGAVSVSVYGSQFGLHSSTVIASFGDKNCDASDWVSDSSMRCKTPQDIHSYIRISAQGTLSSAFTFGRPILSSLDPIHAASQSLASITIFGSNFGLIDPTIKIRIGGTAMMNGDWLSDSSVAGKLSFGIGGSKTVVVTSNRVAGSTSRFFSYDGPYIISLSPSTAPATAGGNIFITGRNFGSDSSLISVFIGSTACTSQSLTVFGLDTIILCGIPRGVGGGLSIRVNVVGTENTEALNAFQYMPPLVSRVSPVFGPTSGLSTITTFGRHYGSIDYSDVVRIGQSNTNWMVYFSDTSLRTRSVPGVGTRLALALSVASQQSSFSQVFSYIRPQISSLLKTNAPASGFVSVTVLGMYFGTHGTTARVSSLATRSLTTDWVSDTSVVFKIAAGARLSRTIELSVGLQLGSTTDSFSYDRSALSGLAVQNGATSASFSLTVVGGSFTNFIGSVRAKLGSVSSTTFSALQWVSDSSILAKISQGSGPKMGVFVSVQSQQSSFSDSFSFDALHVSSLLRRNAPSSGSSNILVFGSKFSAASSHSPSVRIVSTASQLSMWVSDSSLTSKVSSGNSHTSFVTASVFLSSSTVDVAITFDLARVSSVRITNAALSGSAYVTVSGAGFAHADYCNKLRTGVSASSSSVWISDSVIVTKRESGSRSSLQVIITANVRSSGFGELQSYDTAAVSAVIGTSASTGSVVVHLFGIGISSVDVSSSVRMSNSACSISFWISDSSISCKLVAGVNRPGSIPFPVRASIGGNHGSTTGVYSFLLPGITSITLTNVATSGAQLVSLIGSNFGGFDFSARAVLGKTVVAATFWGSDSSTKVKSVACVGADLLTSISVGVAGSVSEVHFSTNSPLPSSVTPGSCPSTASMLAVVLGRSFGVHGSSLSTRTGFSNSYVSTWLSDSIVSCKLLTGVSSNFALLVTTSRLCGSVTGALTFSRPTLSSISPIVAPVSGSSIISVLGRDGGISGRSAHVRVFSSSCEFSSWISESHLLCRVSRGNSAMHPVSVTVGTQSSITTQLFSFEKPSVRVDQSNLNSPSTGCSTHLILGASLGSMSSPAVRVGNSACQSSIWISESSLVCRASHTNGMRLTIYATVDRQIHAVSDLFSGDTSRISNAFPACIPTSGTISVTMIGHNFGHYQSTHFVRVGVSSSPAHLWISTSNIISKMPSGSLYTVMTVISISRVLGELSNALSYLPPLLMNSSLLNSPTSGAVRVTLFGGLFGVSAYSPALNVLQTVCESTLWIADTIVMGKLNSGSFNSLPFVMSMSKAVGSLTRSLSYDQPSSSRLVYVYLLSLFKFPQPTLTVMGLNFATFGGSPTVRVGSSTCWNSVWISQTSVLGRYVSGVSNRLPVLVSSGIQVGSLSERFSYRRPNLEYPSDFDPPRAPYCSPKTGSVLILVLGSALGGNFGMSSDQSVRMRIGSTSVSGSGSHSTFWTSDTSASGKVSSGSSAALSVSLTVGRVFGNTLDKMFCYSQPTAKHMSSLQSFPTSGSTIVFVHGFNLGIFGKCDTMRAGFTSSALSIWISESTLGGKLPPGNSGKLSAAVSVFPFSDSVSLSLSYERPSASSVSPGNGAANGNYNIMVLGSSFAATAASQSLRLGFTSCVSNTWYADSSIICKTASGVNRGIPDTVVAVSVGLLSNTLSAAFSYDGFFISGISPNALISTGAGSVSLLGIGFGAVDYCALSFMGVSQCEASVWVSDAEIRCKTPSGTGQALQGKVVRGSKSTILDSALSFHPPVVSAASPALLLVTGSISITLFGSGYGTTLSSSSARLGHSITSRLIWNSDSSVATKCVHGSGRTLQALVSCGSQQANLSSFTVSYGLAEPSEFVVKNLPTSGSVFVTLVGKFFGCNDASVSIVFVPTSSSSSSWISSSGVSVKVPSGISHSLAVRLSSELQFGSAAKVVSFNSPSVSSAENSFSPASGSVLVSFFGVSFALQSISQRAILGSSAASASLWSSDSSVLAKISSGCHMDASIRISAGRQYGSVSRLFSFHSLSILSVKSQNHPTSAATQLTVEGSSFGIADQSMSAKFGYTSSESSFWVSDSSAISKVPNGVGFQLTFVLSASVASSALPNSTSYEAPTVTSSVRTNGVSTGTQSVTIFGASFGFQSYSDKFRLGSSAFLSSRFLSDTSVRCKTTSGVSRALSFIASAAIQSSSLTSGFSFNAPGILSSLGRNSPSSGSVSITLIGSTYASEGYSDSPRVGLSACEASLWLSASTVVCKLASSVEGRLSLIVSNSQPSPTLSSSFSFDRPTIISTILSSLPSSGAIVIQVQGFSRGSFGFSGAVSLGRTSSGMSLWTSDSLISSKCGAFGASSTNIAAFVSVASNRFWQQISSLVGAISYKKPAVLSFIPTAVATSGVHSVTIFGDHLAVVDSSFKIRLSFSSALASVWLSDSSLRIKGSRGTGLLSSVHLSFNRETSLSAANFSYVAASVLSTSRTNQPTTGSLGLALTGSFFGNSEFSLAVRLGTSASESQRWISDSHLTLKCPIGVGIQMQLTFSVEMITSSASNLMSFDANTVVISYPGGIASTGAMLVGVVGKGMGLSGHSVKLVVGLSKSVFSTWMSSTQVACKSSSGISSQHAVIVSLVNKISGSRTLAISYNLIQASNPVLLMSNIPCTGSVVSIARGSSFGDKGHSPSFRIAHSAAEASGWISESNIFIKLSKGGFNSYQNSLQVVVSVGQQVSLESNVFASYDVASVSLHTRHFPSSGSFAVALLGNNFGSVEPSTSLRMHLTASQSTVWKSDSSISGLLASGSGFRGNVMLSLSTQKHWSASTSISYDWPSSSSIAFQRLATTGSSNLHVFGRGLSVTESSPALRFGRSGSISFAWFSDSAIRARIRQGSGASLTLRVSVSSQSPYQHINVSYSAPVLSSFAGVNGPSSGQYMIDVFGLNFGTVQSSPQAQLGNTGCIFAEWKSDSLARCKIPQGFSRAIGFKMTIDGQSNSQSNVFTYDSPIMNSLSLKNGPTTGHFLVSVYGSKFGPADTTPKILFGPNRFEQSITDYSLWSSDTSIQSKVRPGFGIALGFFLSVDLTQSDILDVFSFDSPVLSSVDRIFGESTGSLILSMYGLQFGTFESKLQFKMSSTAVMFTHWASDSSSSCKIAHGTSNNHGIVVSVARNVKSLSNVFSYINRVVSHLDTSNAPASGARVILASGSQFALRSYSPIMRLDISASQVSQWISDSALQAKIGSGFLSSKSVIVTVVMGLSELSDAFTFDLITSKLSSPLNSVTSGAVSLTIFGIGFGNLDHCSRVSLGSAESVASSCESSDWLSSSAILCKSVSGSGGSLGAVIFQRDHRFSFVSGVISFDGPSLSSIELSTPASSGSATVSVLGSSFALYSVSLSAFLSGSNCEVSLWVSESAVRCKASAGTVLQGSVVVSSGRFYGSLTSILSYLVPILSSLKQTNSPGTGATSFSVFGRSFGRSSQSSHISNGHTNCEATAWSSDSAFSCKTSAGIGQDRIIDVNFNSMTLSQAFSYNALVIRSHITLVLNIPTSGSVSITLAGSGFGLRGYTLRAKAGQTSCSSSNWVSESSVKSKSILGSASRISAIASVGILRGSSTNVLTFDGIVVSSVLPASSPGTGNVLITMFGKSTGLHSGNVHSRVGHSLARSTYWSSDSVAFLKVHQGSYASLSASISFDIRKDVLSQAFSFQAPDSISANNPNSPSSGNVRITVLARNAGVSAGDARAVSVGLTVCVSTIWISGSSIVCRSSEGVGTKLATVVSVGVQRGISDHVVSFDCLTISSFLPANRPTTSAVSITIFGLGMGTFDSSPVSSVNNAMSMFTKWIADSNVRSKAPHANGISLSVKLSVQNIQGSSVAANAFDAAVVSSIAPAVGSSSGSFSITVFGSGLQLVPNSLSVRVGNSASPATQWISDSGVIALILSGAGGALRVQASLGRKSGMSTRVMSYSTPYQLSISGNSPDSGGIYLTLTGRDLSTSSPSAVLKISISSCESSAWVSESSLVVKVSAGSMRLAPVMVTVSLLSSAAQSNVAVSFNFPVVSSVRNAMLSTGANSITVFGRGIGVVDMTAIMRTGVSVSESSSWISGSSIKCKSESGSGRSFGILASFVNRVGSLSSAFLYAGYRPPFLSLISVSNSPSSGSVSVTVFGGEYSSADRSHFVRIASASSALAVVWRSDSSLSAKVTPGVGNRIQITISHGRQTNALFSRAFSYDAAMLSAINPSNSPASGSSSVTCFGTGFGDQRLSARIRLSLSNSIASNWFSDSSLSARSPQGVGNKISGIVTSGVTTGSLTQAFTYNAPLPSSVLRGLQPSTGSLMVSLFGSSISQSQNSAAARFGSTSSAVHTWTSDSSIRSRSVHSLGKAHPVSLSVGGSSASASQLLSFSVPVSVQLNPIFGGTSGSFSVTVLGRSLGLYGASQTVAIGVSVGSSSIWRSDSAINSLVTPGLRMNLQAVISVALQFSSASGSLSYMRPLALSVSPGVIAASGSAAFLVQGNRVGLFSASQSIRLSITSSVQSLWISDSSVSSRACSGVGIFRLVRISSGSQISPQQVSASFGIPELSSSQPSNLPVSGSTSVTVFGREFGRFCSSAIIFVQESRCESSFWLANSAILCKVASGSGFQVSASATVAQQFSTITKFASFDAPIVIVHNSGTFNSPSSGCISVTATGFSFGLTQTSASTRFGTTSCEQSSWRSQSLLVCKSPAGRIRRSTLFVSVSSGLGSNTGLLSYDAAIAQSTLMKPPATGSVFVPVIGRHFATRQHSPSVSVAKSSAVFSQWVSDSSISAMFVSGVGINLPVFVTTGSLVGSASFLASYALPVITNWSPALFATTATMSLTIFGSSFGRSSYSQRTRLRQTSSPATNWQSDSRLIGLIPSGFSRNIIIFATTGSNPGSVSTSVFYSTNVISGATNLNLPTTGSVSVTVFGEGLGIALPTVQARIGGSACLTSTWSSESSMFCKVRSGMNIFRDAFLSIEGRNDRMFLLFSYNAPRLISLAPIVGAAAGGNSLTLSGSGFSISSHQLVTIQIGSTQASVIRWTSDSSVSGSVRGGSGVDMNVKMSAMGQLAPDVLKYSYHAPAISGLETTGCPPTLLNCPRITIYGQHFGLVPGDDVHVLLGGVLVQNTTKLSDSSISVGIKPGAGSGLSVTVSSSSQQSILSLAFSYDAPIPVSASKGNCPTSGSFTAVILGANFGILNLSPHVKLGSSRAISTSWISDTIMIAKSASGLGVLLSVRVSVSTHSSTTSAYTYNKLVLSSVKNSNSPCTGSVLVTILGSAFALTSFSPASKVSSNVDRVVGQTGCETSTWLADSSISCKFPSAAMYSGDAIMTLNVAATFVSGYLTYNMMQLLVALPVIPSSGSALLTSSGLNFNAYDASPLLRSKGTFCETTLWISDSILLCKSPAGPSFNGHVFASLAGRTVLSLGQISFSNPIVSMIDPMTAPVSGFVFVSVFGTLFGGRDVSSGFDFGTTASTSSLWSSDSSVLVKSAHGTSKSLVVLASVSQYIGNVSQVFSFAAPSPRSSLFANAAVTGSSSVLVVGSDFGVFSVSSGFRIAGTSAIRSVWTSFSSISAKVCAGREAASLSVSIGLQSRFISLGLTFDVPTISSAAITNSPHSGSTILTLFGRSFGALDVSDKIFVGSSKCESSVWNSDSAFKCKLSSGHFAFIGILIQYTEGALVFRSRTLTTALSYNVPVVLPIQNSTSSNFPTTGSSVSVIAGSSWNHASSRVVFGISSCEVSIWFSASALLCKTSAGSPTGNSIRVSVNRGIGSVSEAFSYNKPSMSSTAPMNLASTGATLVTIFGQQISLFHASVNVRVGFSHLYRTIWVSDSAIHSLTCASVAKMLHVRVSAASVGLLSLVFSTDSPILSSLASVSNPLTGSFLTIIHGQKFGASALSASTTLGNSISENSRWTSDSSLSAKMVSSFGIARSLVASSFVSTGSLFAAVTFTAPYITSIVAGTSPSSGALQSTILGLMASQSMDSSVSSRISQTSAFSTRWLSSSSLVLKFSAGAGIALSAVVSVTRVNIFSNSFSFCVTSSEACSAPVSSVTFTNSPSSGFLSFTIMGTSFGVVGFSVKSRFGFTAHLAAIWTSDSSISSRSPRGIGSGLSTRVSLNHAGVLAFLSLALSYDSPSPTTYKDRQLIAQESTGAISMTVQGVSFGTAAASQGTRIGGTVARPTRWTSDSSMAIKVVSGISSRLSIFATSAFSVGSLTSHNSYDLPVVSSARYQTSNPGTGCAQISVLGRRFGLSDSSVECNFGRTVAEAARWISSSSLFCKFSSGNGRDISTIASVGVLNSGPSLSLSYALPQVSSPPFFNSARTGSVSLSVMGARFGVASVTQLMSLSGCSCESSKWISDSSMNCKISSGTMRLPNFLVTSALLRVSSTSFVSFDALSPVSVAFVLPGFTGSVMLSIIGKGFSTMCGSARVSFGANLFPLNVNARPSSASEYAKWMSDSCVLGKFGRGFGINLPVRITNGAPYGSVSFTTSYAAPEIQFVNSNVSVPTSGSSLISVFGLNFGSFDSSFRSFLGSSSSQNTVWRSDSELRTKSRLFYGVSQPFDCIDANACID
jgi:hypothetical protein